MLGIYGVHVDVICLHACVLNVPSAAIPVFTVCLEYSHQCHQCTNTIAPNALSVFIPVYSVYSQQCT